jgi:hypothetical protein
VYVLSARLSLELSDCKVVQGSQEASGPKWLTGNHHRPSSFVWSGEDTLCGGRVGSIKVTKGAWQVPKWLAFVASQVVLLGETL